VAVVEAQGTTDGFPECRVVVYAAAHPLPAIILNLSIPTLH
jgi:hypothetical protein